MEKLTNKEFELFRNHIKKHYGISLSDEKKSLIYSRLRVIVDDMGLNSFEEYYKVLIKDKNGDITKRFIDRITTNHTFFMREKEHFEFFTNEVLPYIEKKHSSNKDVRIWCAGCSSGEEAYTLQILMKEYFENKPGWNTQLLATDISNNVLNKAYKGIYSNTSIAELPGSWKSKYFSKSGSDKVQVKDFLKNDVFFTRFNFIEDEFKFKKPFQVIFCRNVMIYFDAETRNELVKKFYSVTEEGGFLFIGQSESLGYSDTKYKYLIPAVYKKSNN